MKIKGTYSDIEVKASIIIELIDELRASKGTIEAIKCDLNEKILDEAKREIAEYESKERYSIIDRIKSLESQVYDF